MRRAIFATLTLGLALCAPASAHLLTVEAARWRAEDRTRSDARAYRQVFGQPVAWSVIRCRRVSTHAVRCTARYLYPETETTCRQLLDVRYRSSRSRLPAVDYHGDPVCVVMSDS